jgi:sugar lactone lactonase YvrE
MVTLHSTPEYSVFVGGRGGTSLRMISTSMSTFDGANGLAWTPDGKLAVTRKLGGRGHLWLEDADGGHARTVLDNGLTPLRPAVAPNGQIVFETDEPTFSIWRVNPDGTGLTNLKPSQV